MLFDLRGRGRRRTIKVIYVFLAFLMGGGLVFFGIGGSGSGLFDVFGQGGATSSSSNDKRLKKKVDAALAKTRVNPKDGNAWLELTRARMTVASSGNRVDPNTGEYSADGKAKLRLAAASWEHYLDLGVKQNEEAANVASLMVRSYAALGDLTKAARAQEIVAESRDSAGAYFQLAALSYQAGQTRKGDLAAKQALAKTPSDQREALKGQLDQAKQQGLINQVTPPSSTP